MPRLSAVAAATDSARPWAGTRSLLAVCVIGLGLIVFSRHDACRRAYNTSTTTTTTQANTTPPLVERPLAGGALARHLRTGRQPSEEPDQTSGIITDGNGVVDIEPARAVPRTPPVRRRQGDARQVPHLRGREPHASSLKLPRSFGKLAGTYGNGARVRHKAGRVQLLDLAFAVLGHAVRGPEPCRDALRQRRDVHLAFLPKGAASARPRRRRSSQRSSCPRRRPRRQARTTTTKPGSDHDDQARQPTTTTHELHVDNDDSSR